MAYPNGEALQEASLCQVRERHRLPNSMHAPRACLAVLRSAAVEFGRVVSVRQQVHDVHRGKWVRGVQLEAVVVNLSLLCAFRAVAFLALRLVISFSVWHFCSGPSI